ncbi:hypothetical protein FA95DRAFT_1580193 [Auriscalpium vulgare]|uniref:Uncharacterized protein n=1 Tax=Auriscalpium vulgare TaxID=40419 RepID=A0ACB8S7A9_9AGAM|nr:hypothetical protein FA95DRAFT_1580193 [Auriscalpium vulgare]
MFSVARQCSRALVRNAQRTVIFHAASSSPTYTSARTLTSSRPSAAAAALAQLPPSKPTVLLLYPTQQDLEAAELDAEAIPPEDARIDLTDRAAEVCPTVTHSARQQLRTVASREGNSESALRISVESGGCHGYQYKMELTTHREPEDYQFSHPSIKPANVVVDALSLGLLKGSTIDFATELIGSSFRVLDNPQAKGSGCGCGVSWEPNI